LPWSLTVDSSAETRELVGALAALGAKSNRDERELWSARCQAWLAEAEGRDRTIDFALECLAWCQALPRLAHSLAERGWWELLQYLVDATATDDRTSWLTRPVAAQLIGGELPLALACQFPEVAACRELAGRGRKILAEGMLELLDGEGLPHARHLPHLRTLLACWTRAGYLDRLCGGGRLSAEAREQYRWLVLQTLRLTRHDGCPAFALPAQDASCRDLCRAAVALGGRSVEQFLARRVLDGVGLSRRGATRARLPGPAEHSEWAEAAVLRADWASDSPLLAVTYDRGHLLAECSAAGRLLWSGSWNPEVRIDSAAPLLLEDGWCEVAWEVNDEAVYLELEAALSEGWTLQRQLLLARKDQFLYVADAVVGPRPARIDYRCRLPLVEGVGWEPATETRECYLQGKRPLAAVLPLALPEWRIDRRHGTLEETSPELHQLAEASALYAPLLIDLNPSRLRKTVTWRQLTVAENMQAVPAEVAVSYRVQVGDRQWVIYRSLAPRGNRTFLGQNHSSEFVAARFQRSGEVEVLVEIE
jgi:hypothetical protein